MIVSCGAQVRIQGFYVANTSLIYQFLFQDEHLLFFLENSLTETIKVGTDWRRHTSPWADVLGNPEWPAEIKNSHQKHNEGAIAENTDEDISDNSVTEEEVDVEFTISNIEVEEDEVDRLVNDLL
jgi:hypothetical protein